MDKIAAEIVQTVDALKRLLQSAGLSPEVYIEFNDHASGKKLHAFLTDGLGRSSDPSVWPQTIPEYKLLSRDEATVSGVKLRWPIQSAFPSANG
ncbi:hypothetical protein [Methylobacterium radiotolerans]|uniref:hypothetical protein n=1 Tax=Methylobacterium radiotolerans TaxID=31998 RepID=UPI000D5E5B94|nr:MULTISPECIES: hypothetical protein [Methylobacterium]MDE3750351.1 hypothetical protein [Methylobacterium radiotolerans]PVY84257.1 hypothetical protein C7388_1657 [Methylobacterium organophilum]